MLKRRILQNYNRPRADMVVYLIQRPVIRKIEHAYSNLFKGITKPHWWSEMIKIWKKAKSTGINVQYETNQERLICYCHSFINSPHQICKHLVKSRPLSHYRDINRNRKPPFLVIRRQ